MRELAQVAAEFDARAQRYEDDEFHPWLAAQVAARLPADPCAVLDVGAGSGLVSAHSRPGSPAVLADVSLAMLRVARDRGRSTRLVCADAHRLPFAAATFDVVTCVAVDSFLDLPAFVVEAARALRPDGRLLMTLWADPPSTPHEVTGAARALVAAHGLTLVAQETLEWERAGQRRRCVLACASVRR